MQSLQASPSPAARALGRLPDDVYALRSAAYAERVGPARAAQGFVGSDLAPQGCAGQGGVACHDLKRAEIVHRAICRSSAAAGAGCGRSNSFSGVTRLPAFRLDTMLAVLVAASAGYCRETDLMAALGLCARSAQLALRDCVRRGLMRIDKLGSLDVVIPTEAGLLALHHGSEACA